jgi:hypothetical protein
MWLVAFGPFSLMLDHGRRFLKIGTKTSVGLVLAIDDSKIGTLDWHTRTRTQDKTN